MGSWEGHAPLGDDGCCLILESVKKCWHSPRSWRADVVSAFFLVGFLGLDGDEPEGREGGVEEIACSGWFYALLCWGAQDEAFSRPN